MRSNHLSKMRTREAAKDYMHGIDLRMQCTELSDKALAGKFECHISTIKRVREHLPVERINDSDQRLIRSCVHERGRLEEQLQRLSKAYLCRHYGVSPEAVDIELDLAGWEDPRQKRKQRRTAA